MCCLKIYIYIQLIILPWFYQSVYMRTENQRVLKGVNMRIIGQFIYRCYCDTKIMEKTKGKITMNSIGIHKSPPFESIENLKLITQWNPSKRQSFFYRKLLSIKLKISSFQMARKSSFDASQDLYSLHLEQIKPLRIGFQST